MTAGKSAQDREFDLLFGSGQNEPPPKPSAPAKKQKAKKAQPAKTAPKISAPPKAAPEDQPPASAPAVSSPPSPAPAKKKAPKKSPLQKTPVRKEAPSPGTSTEASHEDEPDGDLLPVSREDDEEVHPVTSQEDKPWEKYNLAKEVWEKIPLIEKPIVNDEDALNNGLVPQRFVDEFDRVMGMKDATMWQREWIASDKKKQQTVELTSDTQADQIAGRTPSHELLYIKIPQLWVRAGTSAKTKLEDLEILTYEQKQIDQEALFIKYKKENNEAKLGMSHKDILRAARQQFNTLMAFLLFREDRLERDNRRMQGEKAKEEKLLSSTSAGFKKHHTLAELRNRFARSDPAKK